MKDFGATGACACTGACLKPGGKCSAFPNGRQSDIYIGDPIPPLPGPGDPFPPNYPSTAPQTFLPPVQPFDSDVTTRIVLSLILDELKAIHELLAKQQEPHE